MVDGEAPNPTSVFKSDLPARTVSAMVMLVVAGGALWLGNNWWTIFVALTAAGVYHEWSGLVGRFAPGHTRRHYAWQAGGIIYIGFAAIKLVELRGEELGLAPVMAVILGVIATDIGAYFAGRVIGGPKIAPAISPSKTWAGLGGGIVGASLALLFVVWLSHLPAILPSMQTQAGLLHDTYAVFSLGGWVSWLVLALAGALVAIIAQAGDFFESWLKRCAGVKDSGKLIPGHGGLFDRVDGLLALVFVGGIVQTLHDMVT